MSVTVDEHVKRLTEQGFVPMVTIMMHPLTMEVQAIRAEGADGEINLQLLAQTFNAYVTYGNSKRVQILIDGREFPMWKRPPGLISH